MLKEDSEAVERGVSEVEEMPKAAKEDVVSERVISDIEEMP